MVAISSMTSRGYVSHQMIRSICCRTNKVDDVDDANTVIIKGNYVDTVFVFFSSNILNRALLGKLISALEDKNLTSQAIQFKIVGAADQKSSSLFRNFKEKGNVGVFTIWKGQDAFKRVEETLSRIGSQHAINRSDILYTTTAAQTRKEIDIWMSESVAISAAKQNGKPTVDEKVLVNDSSNDSTPTNQNGAEAGTVEAAEVIDSSENKLSQEVAVNKIVTKDDQSPDVVTTDNATAADVPAGTASAATVPAPTATAQALSSNDDTATTETVPAKTPSPPPITSQSVQPAETS